MADIDFKNSVNIDTAFVDGHKVKLIAVPDGTLELPISANDEYGYVVDANNKKHRVLLTAFLSGDPDYKPAPNADTAYMTVNGQKVKVRLVAKLNGTQYLSNSANVNDCYTEDDDGNKHRTILVTEPTGTLELPTSETNDSAYVIDNNGNKHKVRLFAVLAGGTTEVKISGVPPLNLLGAVEDSLLSVKAYGGLLQSNVPLEYTQIDYATKKGTAGIQGKFDTGIMPTVDDVKIEMKVKIGDEAQAAGQLTVGSFYACQSRVSASGNITGISGSSATASINGMQNGQSVASGIARVKDHIDVISYEYKNGNHSIYVKDLTTNTEDTQTGTYTFAAPSKNLYIFGNTTTTNNLNNNNALYYCKIWVSGSLAFDAVPVIRDSDNKVGLYDKVSESFIEPIVEEGGGFVAGDVTLPTPSDPMDLYCNNGILKVLDKTQWTIFTNPTSIVGQGVFINSTGKWQAVSDRGAGCAIPLTIGKQYTLVIHKKTAGVGTMLRYGQSPQINPTGAGIQLTDWYRGGIEDGQMVSFIAKQPYLVMQLSAVAVEAGMVQEAIEVLEAQGNNETLSITTKNLYNIATDTDGYYIGADGTIGTNADSCYSALIPVVAGQTYTWSGICGNSGGSNNKRVHAYIDDVWNQQVDLTEVTKNQPFEITFTVPAGCNGIRISHWNTDTQGQVEVGSTKTDYIEYNGSTAGVANLFAINTYKDVQEIITGTVKHKVNVYVLNGEETAWNDVVSSSSYAMPKTALGSDSNVLPNKSTDVICSHYSVATTESGSGVQDIIWVGGSNVNFKTKTTYATLQDWKDYLAAQYAAGTPVIVVYPLATAQDEVAPVPQTMQTVAGDNTLDIVQAGMSGLEVSATYMKGTSVTITEIEDANVGNNVEVVIA